MSPNRAMSPQGLKRALRHAPSARAAWRLLPKAGRLRIKRDFEQLGYRADLWNRRSQSSGGQPSPETVDRLREHFAGEADELAALLGVSPPWLAPRNGE